MSDSIKKFEEMNQREVIVTMDEDDNSSVIHPQHYGGKDNLYEAIKVIEAWEVGFNDAFEDAVRENFFKGEGR
jgi:hypothetical protein